MQKKRGRLINPSAKKYSSEKRFKIKTKDGYSKVSLKQKQALANRFLKEARNNLGSNHRTYVATMNRIHMFQKKHGQSRRPTLSTESLRTGDIDMYNQLLDSVIDSTFINPENYQEFKSNQLDFAISKGWAKDYKEAEEIYNFRNSSLFEELEDLNLVDIPSEILDRTMKYGQADMSLEDFKQMTRTYLRGYANKSLSSNEFFDYSDKYLAAKKARKDDFDKAVDTYLENTETTLSFLEFLNQF